MSRKLNVMLLGLRGFPNVQGGVEKHAEHLFPILSNLGCKVNVLARSPYQPSNIGNEWKGIQFRWLWAPKTKGLEAIVHSFIGVIYAAIKRPDILHIHAVGPGLVTPLARLLGLKVVMTHHGPDYERQKWGALAKFVLRVGEYFSMRLANERIVVSQGIRSLVFRQYGRDSIFIPNGTDLPDIPQTDAALQRFGLISRQYILLVSRLVPEKRHFDLIEAFRRTDLPNWKLVFVGDSDHPDAYSRQLLDAGNQVPNVVFTGFQSGISLTELYAHAGLFVLPSSHEGLPIALLEALSYGLPAVVSDIEANLEIGLSGEHYFPLGNVSLLAERIRDFACRIDSSEIREMRRSWVKERYNWDHIASRTFAVYQKVVG
jgi:glycosyltransferase involved in cell wall biosynthesis